jgi:hypothetical protein
MPKNKKWSGSGITCISLWFEHKKGPPDSTPRNRTGHLPGRRPRNIRIWWPTFAAGLAAVFEGALAPYTRKIFLSSGGEGVARPTRKSAKNITPKAYSDEGRAKENSSRT